MTHCRRYTWSKTASPLLSPLMLPYSFTLLMLAHESALLLFHHPIHEILSICHTGSWIFATDPIYLPYPRDSQHLSCWLINLCCCRYTTLYSRFTASVMLAHESLLQKLTLPYSQDSQHPSCWLMNLCYKTCTALFTRFSASVMLHKAFTKKTCVGTCTNFQRKPYRPEKRDKKGNFWVSIFTPFYWGLQHKLLLLNKTQPLRISRLHSLYEFRGCGGYGQSGGKSLVAPQCFSGSGGRGSR
jgi:hypothetical protein